eukprot:TRINITY_DN2799_c0_g1_i1.p1 TRINITY_DN2799_c0_g1~~TRINITY_DN2799_c0_g1_i1.p1  ORF type:complete len:294 (+),score=22.32 TRINITY_DN2799_c0_g1_i1:6-887(+)
MSTRGKRFICRYKKDIDYCLEKKKRFVIVSKVAFLNLQERELKNDDIELLSYAMKRDKSITKLNLMKNKFDANGIQFLVDALKHNTTLTHLNLSDNNIGNEGAKLLKELLQVNQCPIVNLDLSRGKIKAEGLRYISEGLTHNSVLRGLSLAYNNDEDRGLTSISDCLKINTSLTYLDLDGFLFYEPKLKEALKINSTLKYLILYPLSRPKGIKRLITQNQSYDLFKHRWTSIYRMYKKDFPNRIFLLRIVYCSIKIAIRSKIDVNDDVLGLILKFLNMKLFLPDEDDIKGMKI